MGKINKFVEHETRSKIKELFKSDMINSDTRVILVNTNYFKGDWLHTFDEKFTKKHEFDISNDQTVQKDFMFVHGTFNFANSPSLDAIAIELNCDKSNYSFVIVLPNSPTGLSTMETKLQSKNL